MNCFLSLQCHLVSHLVADRFYLKSIGVGPALPEPDRGTKLNIPRVNACYLAKRLEQALPANTVLYAKRKISDSVSDRPVVGGRNWTKTAEILFASTEEVPITALERKTLGKAGQGVDYVDNRFVNGATMKCLQGGLAILGVSQILHQLFGFSESFQRFQCSAEYRSF
jgi:hypothetical protein